MKSLSMSGLIPFLTGAIQEQQKQIEKLNNLLGLTASSTSSAWSINADGNLVVKSLSAESAVFDEITAKIGVTVKDSDTGENQCLYVASGVVRSRPGTCRESAPIPVSTIPDPIIEPTPAPEPTPEPVIESTPLEVAPLTGPAPEPVPNPVVEPTPEPTPEPAPEPVPPAPTE